MKILFFALIMCAAIGANAQPPEGKATVGTVYGANVTAEDAKQIAELPEMLAKTPKVNTKVKAKILDVCPKKGCWLKLAVNDSTTAFVKMEDYGFFLPLDAIGKNVVLDAEASMTTTSVAELKHYAADAKKSKEEIAAITQPKKEIKLLAKGIVVVE